MEFIWAKGDIEIQGFSRKTLVSYCGPCFSPHL